MLSSARRLLRHDGYQRVRVCQRSEFTRYLVKDIGVATVPGSSFYNHPRDGAQQVRFAFCKSDETLDEAGERLRKLRAR